MLPSLLLTCLFDPWNEKTRDSQLFQACGPVNKPTQGPRTSGVGERDAEGASTHPKVLIC